MSAGKMIASGVMGFALGAGLMMTPESNKWKRKVKHGLDMVKRKM